MCQRQELYLLCEYVEISIYHGMPGWMGVRKVRCCFTVIFIWEVFGQFSTTFLRTEPFSLLVALAVTAPQVVKIYQEVSASVEETVKEDSNPQRGGAQQDLQGNV